VIPILFGLENTSPLLLIAEKRSISTERKPVKSRLYLASLSMQRKRK
jgi:hypothetical protein